MLTIEIKNIKLGPGSQETTQYVADLFIDGKKVANLNNSGHGGSTNMLPTDGKLWPLLKQAEKQLEFEAKQKDPEAKSCDGFIQDLADDMACAKENEKEIQKTLKKMDRACISKIIVVDEKELEQFKFGKTSQLAMSEINLKTPLSSFPQEQLKTYILKVKNSLKEGEIIYNKNLPQ